MSTPVNIVVALIGAGAVTQGLASVREGLAGVGDKAAQAVGDSTGLARVATVAGITAAALGGLRSALGLGGELADLSARTGQSVRDLVVFRRALDNAGIGAANAAPTIALLHRSIAGLNEEGGKTDEAFAKLGLVPARLKQMGIQQQIEALTTGFAKIENPAERAALAMQLFGRSGAQMLQLLGESGALAAAGDEVGDLADRMQRTNATFDTAGDRLSLMKSRLLEMAAAATEQLLPVLTAAADVIKGLSLGGSGAILGGALPAAIGAVLAAKLVPKLDNAMLDWATRSGAPIGQTFAARFGAPFTGLLARLLPIGLALMVGKSIIDGVTAGLIDSENQMDALRERQARKQKQLIRELSEVRSEDERQAKIKDLRDQIEAFEKLRNSPGETIPIYDSENGRSRRKVGERQTTRGLNEEEASKLQRLKDALATMEGPRGEQIVAENQAKDAAAKRLEDAKALSEKLKEQAETYKKQAEEAQYALAADREKLDLLDGQLAKAQAQYAADVRAAELAGNAAAGAAAESKLEAAILAIAKERQSVEQNIAAAAERAAKQKKEAAEAAARAATAARQAQLEAGRNALDARQLEIQRAIMELEADTSRTDAEKYGARRQQLEAAVEAARAYLAVTQQIRDATPEGEGRQQAQANVISAQQGVQSAEGQLTGMGPDPNSFVAQLEAGITSLRASWGTLAQDMAQSITGALDIARNATSDFLYNAISGAENMRQAWNSALLGIGRQFLRTATDMVAKMIWRATVERALIALGVTTHVAGEATKTGATLAGAAARLGAIVKEALASVYKGAVQAFEALSSIPYVGPFLGAAAMAAAIAGGIALVSKIGGHEEGGLVRGGQQLSWLNESGEEFVFSAPAVRNMGADRLTAMHEAARRGDLSAFASVGPAAAAPSSGGAGGDAGRPLTVAILDPSRDRSVIEEMERDPRSDVWFVNKLQQHRLKIPGVRV